MAAPRLPGPRGFAQLAPLRRIFRDPQPVLDELSGAYGPVVELGAGPVRMAIVGDPALLRELFSTSNESFKWGHKFNVLGLVTGATSMVVSDGADHKRRRSAVQSVFSRRRLNGWIPEIVEQTDLAIDALPLPAAGDAVIDLYPVGRNLVLDVVIRVLFGPGMVERSREIGERFERPQAYLESPAIRQIPHRIPRTRRAAVRDDRRALDAIFDAEIAACRATPDADRGDVLSKLVADSVLTDTEIRDQVMTLIGAGFDTTAASLAWMLWCAALSPGVWQRLRDEADDVLGPVDGGDVSDGDARSGVAPSGTPLDDSTLRRLVFANAVMHETLRLHPAGVLSPREAVGDVALGDHVVRSGTLILWSAHLAGRDAGVWADPTSFDPDRMRDLDDEQRAICDRAWVPFGGGSRNCIGFALAQMELTLMISRLAQRLDIAPTAAVAPRPVGMVVNRPTGGAPMRVARRG